MARFLINDIKTIENASTSPAMLRAKIGDMILHSTVATARVESINADTGEYRVVLQGTLDREESKKREE